MYTILSEYNQQTYEDVCRMKYTLGVLYESLRLFTPVIFVVLLIP